MKMSFKYDKDQSLISLTLLSRPGGVSFGASTVKQLKIYEGKAKHDQCEIELQTMKLLTLFRSDHLLSLMANGCP